ncbi:hypothetical protein [Flavobacterium phragmitis]|uniref:SusD family protein n=1 Tax=Flavobacterium phragmitis TaxID=739143 RepID=A0A1I1KWZ8_9FLAO|nr:hypothetical protein [Flavobacterium phragmitis]SFC65319.1 hypothetical protein SAMN05216297_101588 [Flavobacterium phragmitis]
MKKLSILILVISIFSFTACSDFESLDKTNENLPDIKAMYAPKETFSLISNGYNTWYNGSIAASPTIGFACAELFQAGTAGWGSGTMWFRPRQDLFNNTTPDPVIIINYGAWYNYYTAVGSTMVLAKQLQNPEYKIVLNGIDYTQRVKAHNLIIQGLLYGNIAMLYDKAYLFKENDNAVNFDYKANTKSYKEVMDYAIAQIDSAIKIIEADPVDTDYSEVIAGTVFDKATLLQFANSMAARLLVGNARTPAENAQTDWAKVESYALKGLQQNFAVDYRQGWRGKVMTRDEGMNYFALHNMQWIRASQWLLHLMAPDDPNSAYPFPDGVKRMAPITNCPDARLNKYFSDDNDLGSWFGFTRATRPGYGTFIMSEYKYTRYHDVVFNESGAVDHFLKAENDLYIAEAKYHLHKGGAATYVNNSRVGLGNLSPASDGDTDLLNKIFYERYVECDMVWPQLGFFDKRRTGTLLPGTVFQFPIPAPELISHGQPVYTFGANNPM